jgi:hypothetical protein
MYDELRQLAAQRLSREKLWQAPQPIALVHAAYFRLVGADPKQPWDSLGRFFAGTAEAMRRIRADTAGAKRAAKRRPGRRRVDVTPDEWAARRPNWSSKAAPQARLVELHYFAGLTVREAAAALGISTTCWRMRPRTTASCDEVSF